MDEERNGSADVPVWSPTFSLLLREITFAGTVAGEGLTILRKLGIGNSQAFHTGATLLAIGIERILKVTFAYVHWFESGHLPNRSEFKGFGHNIVGLSREVDHRFWDLGWTSEFPSWTTRRHRELAAAALSILSALAVKERYFNLDSLARSSSGDVDLTQDPVARWEREVLVPLRGKKAPVDPKFLEAMSRMSTTRTLDHQGRVRTDFGEVVDDARYNDEDGRNSVRMGLLLFNRYAQCLAIAEDELRLRRYEVPFSWEILRDLTFVERIGDTARRTWRIM